nr:hypothetical protein [Salmonella enterica]
MENPQLGWGFRKAFSFKPVIKTLLAHVDKLSEDAFDDQCTGANPRYPLVSELRQLLLASFYGEAFAEQ